jgi:hypothetical protein
VTARLAYHATWLGEVPFALATFSDGAVYEGAAFDILEHPPLGSRAFYLQGIYAYLLALPMAIKPWISLGLLLQLALAAASWCLFHRGCVELWGRTAGRLSSLAFLLVPAVAFYENKYLTASLTVTASVLVFDAFVAWARRGGAARLVWLGAALALGVLARPNFVLVAPFVALAVHGVARRRDGRGSPAVAVLVVALALALAPMAARNLVVTGHADLGPAHGGGTSFWIGNNPQAVGVWHAGGLLSATVGAEVVELREALEIQATDPRDEARAIGDALYRRAFAFIREHPGQWLALEAKKAWLLAGNDELTQDYDWYGERELIPWANRIGVPFGVLLGLAVFGIGARRQAASDADTTERGAHLVLLGLVVATVAANLIYFTSSQHRVPLAVPLAALSGPGIVALVQIRRGGVRASALLLAVAALLAAQGFWPRRTTREPHPVHYFNLAVVWDEIGEPLEALAAVERAVEGEPTHPLFRLRRAHLRARLGELDGAEVDFTFVIAAPDAPSWAVKDAERGRAGVLWTRENAFFVPPGMTRIEPRAGQRLGGP